MTRTVNKGALPFDLSGDSPDHDRRFREKMQEALAGLKDGSNAEFGEAEWRTIAELKRAELSSLALRKDR